MFSRIAYRANQFWNALPVHRKWVKTEALLPYLSPTWIVLFRRMQPFEQAHAFKVFERLKSAGRSDPELLSAALLHDVGKILYPLSLFDRVVIVVGKYFFGERIKGWSLGTPGRLSRPFVVAECHPEWGADLAAQAGASPRVTALIRSHQNRSSIETDSNFNDMLNALQEVDDEN